MILKFRAAYILRFQLVESCCLDLLGIYDSVFGKMELQSYSGGDTGKLTKNMPYALEKKVLGEKTECINN